MSYRVKYSILVQGFISKRNTTTLLFYPIYLLRRLICSAVLVFLPNQQAIQLTIFCISSVVVRSILVIFV